MTSWMMSSLGPLTYYSTPNWNRFQSDRVSEALSPLHQRNDDHDSCIFFPGSGNLRFHGMAPSICKVAAAYSLEGKGLYDNADSLSGIGFKAEPCSSSNSLLQSDSGSSLGYIK